MYLQTQPDFSPIFISTESNLY